MRADRALLATLLCTTLMGLASSVSAQPLPSFDARTWRPSTDPAAGLAMEPVATPGPGNWSVGAFLSYAHRPIVLTNTATGDVVYRPLEAVLGADLVLALGLGTHASLGLSIPTVLYQQGSEGMPATVHTTGSVPFSAIGDLGLHGKAVILPNDGGGFGLAALGTLTMPTGDRTAFLGEGSATVTARLLAEYTLIIASMQASVGYTLRTAERVWPDATAGGTTFGDVIPFTAGISFKPAVLKIDSGNRQRWDVAVHGWLPATPVGPFGAGDPGSAKETPMLLALSDRIALGSSHDAYALVGLDIGLTSAVGVPAVRGVLGLGWAPREHDQDHDGVPDDVDQCPDVPEDKDGFEDSDGCPDLDNDDDGILDREDACPNVKGPANADAKKNGCPVGDADGDGIPDDADACPNDKGPHSDDPKTNGCPDKDGDGIPDALDKCPDDPEDKDGFEDKDGCPDPDNDGDGIGDKTDACPNERGEPSADPSKNGCPNPDRDGDTYENDVDKCPEDAEVYNGVQDDDGCPDEGGKPLVVIEPKEPHAVRLAAPLKTTGGEAPELEPASKMTLRALGLELHRHREWSLAVGARPAGGSAEQQQGALARALVVVQALGALTRRDGIAETVGWDAVKKQPGADSGFGILVLKAAPEGPKAPLPKQKP